MGEGRGDHLTAFGLRVLLRLRCHTLLRELIGKWVLSGSTRGAGGLSPIYCLSISVLSPYERQREEEGLAVS